MTSPSARQHGTRQLERLCALLRLSALEIQRAKDLFGLLSESWGGRPLDQGPAWPSEITGDGAPYEFSLAFDDQSELRFLAEVGATPRTQDSAWRAALATTERLANRYDLPLDRLHAIQDLFRPIHEGLHFALWHAVCLRPSEPPDIKIYLNPSARGPALAAACVEQALVRLGFAETWAFLRSEVLRDGDRLIYFSLDLSHAKAARVKIYLVHPGRVAADLEPILATDPSYVPGGGSAFIRAVLGRDGPPQRPLGTCHAFTSESSDRPHSVTLHIPLVGAFESDAAPFQAMLGYLSDQHQDTLAKAIAAITPRSLESAAGLFQWVSMRWRKGQGRLTMYLCPEAYRIGA